jgi:hypothetical protein
LLFLTIFANKSLGFRARARAWARDLFFTR